MRVRSVALALPLALALAGAAASSLPGCSTDTKFSGVEPNTGTFTGGEEVVLAGQNFPRNGATVRFCPSKAAGDTSSPTNCKDAQPVVIESERKIRVTTPAGDKNTNADITLVFDDGRSYLLRNAFRYIDSTQQRQTMDKFFNKASGEKK